MLEMNKVMLIGNLTRDPELSYLTSGTALAKLGLAVSRRYKGKNGEYQEETAFVDIDVWAQRAEFCSKYLKKGTRIYVEGRLRFNTWDAQDGSKRSKLTVTAESVEFALPKGQSEGGYQSQGNAYGGGAPQQAAPAPQQQQPPAAPQSYPQQTQQQGYSAPPAGGQANTDDDLPF